MNLVTAVTKDDSDLLDNVHLFQPPCGSVGRLLVCISTVDLHLTYAFDHIPEHGRNPYWNEKKTATSPVQVYAIALI